MNDPTAGAENMPPPPPRTPRVAAPATLNAGDYSNNMASPSTSHEGILARTTNQKRRSSDGLPPRHPPNNKRRFSFAGGVNVQFQYQGDNDNNDAGKFEDAFDDLEYSGDEEGDEEYLSEKQEQQALTELDSMMKMGLRAFQDRERLQQEITAIKDDNAAKASENSRLRTALKQKQEIITVRTVRGKKL